MSSYQSAVDQLLRRGFGKCLGDWGSVLVCRLGFIHINLGTLSAIITPTWKGHAVAPGLSRSSQHSVHGSIYGHGSQSV